MTTVAAMICTDGIVMGSDTKVVSSDIKWSENKLTIAKLGESPLIIGGSGSLRHIQDAIAWMELDGLSKTLGADTSFNKFLDTVIERNIPIFARDYQMKYGTELDLEMLVCCIDIDNKPKLVVVYSDGEYDHIRDAVAIGSGSIFGEILLRKLYSPDITVEFAKKLIGYIIWEIQGIDNNSGEDMQIVCINCNRTQYIVPEIEIATYKQLPSLVHKSYTTIRRELEGINTELIKQALETMRDTIKKSALPDLVKGE